MGRGIGLRIREVMSPGLIVAPLKQVVIPHLPSHVLRLPRGGGLGGEVCIPAEIKKRADRNVCPTFTCVSLTTLKAIVDGDMDDSPIKSPKWQSAYLLTERSGQKSSKFDFYDSTVAINSGNKWRVVLLCEYYDSVHCLQDKPGHFPGRQIFRGNCEE